MGASAQVSDGYSVPLSAARHSPFYDTVAPSVSEPAPAAGEAPPADTLALFYLSEIGLAAKIFELGSAAPGGVRC